MAHPIVDKLQDFGIRHGEKVGVAVVSAACLLMLWTAMNQPSTSHTVEEITKATTQAEQNLRNPQKEDDVRIKIREEGIKQPDFEKVVDNRKPGTADATRYQLVNVLEAPEPGAGLLRERPELITIAKLEAHSGRGSIRLYEIDEKTGDFAHRPIKSDEPKQAKKKKRNNRNGMMGRMMGGMGQAGGGMGRMMGGNQGGANKKDDAATKKRDAENQRRFNNQIAGDVDPNAGNQAGDQDQAQQNAGLPPGEEYVESHHGFRWAVLTGVVDNKQLRDNYARALKLDPSGAFVHYVRVDLQRRSLQDDGTWSKWEMVDRKYSIDNVLDLLTEIEPETSPDNLPILDEKAKVDALCDPLPFLDAGYWAGVYHADAINPEVLKKKDTTKKAAGGGALAGANMGGGMDEMSMMAGRGSRSGGAGRMPGSNQMAGGMGGMMAGSAGGGEGGAGAGQYGMMFGGGATNKDEDKDFTKTEADKLPVRVLDFTVEPDTTYQFRARLVVHNPNYRVENVMPGVDATSKELNGDWSEPSPIVTVPPDVQTYVRGPSVQEIRNTKPGALTFGVVRWKKDDGLTVVQSFTQGVGEILGDETTATVPVEDEKGETKKRTRSINFTSDRLFVDSSGGPVPADRLQLGTAVFNEPAAALLLRADGRIVYRDEASDLTSGELAEMTAIYNRSLKDAEAGKKETSNSFGGMMGGGMPGSMGSN